MILLIFKVGYMENRKFYQPFGTLYHPAHIKQGPHFDSMGNITSQRQIRIMYSPCLKNNEFNFILLQLILLILYNFQEN